MHQKINWRRHHRRIQHWSGIPSIDEATTTPWRSHDLLRSYYGVVAECDGVTPLEAAKRWAGWDAEPFGHVALEPPLASILKEPVANGWPGMGGGECPEGVVVAVDGDRLRCDWLHLSGEWERPTDYGLQRCERVCSGSWYHDGEWLLAALELPGLE